MPTAQGDEVVSLPCDLDLSRLGNYFIRGEFMSSSSGVRMASALALVALLSFGAGVFAQSRFGDMDGAENSLQRGLGQLEHARDIFGGHRDNAIGLVNQAIGEIEAGKQYAASHGY